jgi:hypothetical protein
MTVQECSMQIEEYEDLLESREEQLAVHLFGMSYKRLAPELKGWIRSRVIDSVWSEYTEHGPVAAA